MRDLLRNLLAIPLLCVSMQTAIAGVIGWHDMADSVRTTGWTCDNANPSHEMAVHFYMDNTFIGGTSAHNHREPAVGSACGGNAERGFDYVFPSNIKDGQTHWIYAYGYNVTAGTVALLGGSPIQVTFPSGPPPMPPPTCTSSAPQSSSTTATSGGFVVYAYGVQNATEVWFPTWADPGMADVVWYQGSNLGGGTWAAAVNLGAHFAGNPIYGTFNVHVYAFNPDYQYQFCSGTQFTRTQPAVASSAHFEFQSVPNVMQPGRTYPVEIIMTNTGSNTWTAAQSFRLAALNSMWGVTRVNLPASVPPGQSVTFAFNVTSPTRVGGNKPFQWQMVQDASGTFFGETTPLVNINVIPETPKGKLFDQALATESVILPQQAPPQEQPGVQINTLGMQSNAATLSWDMGPYTGFSTATPFSSYQRGPKDVVGSTGAQSYNKTIGLWMNTLETMPTTANLLNISFGFEWSSAKMLYPWSNAANILNGIFDFNIYRVATAPGKEAYFGFNYTFVDARSGQTLYYGATIFDPRGVQETAMFDSCQGCSRWMIIGTTLENGTLFGHRTTPYVDPRFVTQTFLPYGLGITKTEFERGLAAGNARIQQTCDQQVPPLSDIECRKLKLSPYAADYRLVVVNLGAEIAISAGPGAQIGGSMRNMKISID